MSIGAAAAAGLGKAAGLAAKYGPAVIAGAKKIAVPMFKGIGKGIQASAKWMKGKTGQILVAGKKIAESNGSKSADGSAKKGIAEAMYWLNENNQKTAPAIIKAAGGVVMTGVAMAGINMLGMNLARMVQKNCANHQCDYSKSNLSHCKFDQCDNRGSSFAGADMKNTMVSRSNMSGTDQRGVNLGNARIMGSNFRNANLDRAMLGGTVFKDVDFTGAKGTVYTDQYTNFINCTGMEGLSKEQIHRAGGIVLDRNSAAMQAVRNIDADPAGKDSLETVYSISLPADRSREACL